MTALKHARHRFSSSNDEFLLRYVMSVALMLVVGIFSCVSAQSASVDARDIRVIDGDTVRLNGQQPDVRLIGFNAPETRRAACPAERVLGDQATRRLRDLVRGGRLDLNIVKCACRPGTEGTFGCNYGRACGVLKVDGRDVGDTLIKEGLAVRFECGESSCPPTPKPWCR